MKNKFPFLIYLPSIIIIIIYQLLSAKTHEIKFYLMSSITMF